MTLTDMLDALRAVGALPAGWAYASGNWGLLVETTGKQGVPATVAALLFGGVIAWGRWRRRRSGGRPGATAEGP